MEEIKPTEGRTVYSPPSRPSKPATIDSPSQPAKDLSPQFVSPKGSIDAESGVFVTEVRDTGTGKVAFQYPPQKVVAAYAHSRETESETESETEKVQLAPKALEQSNASEGKAESNPKVESSTMEDAVTDGTTGQEQG